MEYTVPVDDDTVSEIVRKSLQEMIDINLRDGDDDLENRALIASMMIVLEYYSTKDQYESFVEEMRDELIDFTSYVEQDISDIETENDDDGSLIINMNVTDDVANRLASLGVEFLIMKEALGATSTDQLLAWAEAGKGK